MIRPKLKKATTIAWLLIALGAIGLIISGALYLRQAKPPVLSPKVNAVNVSPAPSSVKPRPTAVVNYNVPPTDPKYIAIPSVGLKQARIMRLGLSGNGQIATPTNIYDTGWYDGSAKPGQAGAMFIYGHVSSWTANGVFYNLKKLKPGDDITITRGDDTTYTYQVVSSKTYPYNNVDMSQVLSPINTTKPGLNLMTCTGNIIKGTSEFNERLVVYTSLVNN